MWRMIQSLEAKNRSIEAVVKRLEKDVHRIKGNTTVREVTTELDAHFIAELNVVYLEEISNAPKERLYEFEKENRRGTLKQDQAGSR
jgi:hypothetical protein